MDKEYVASGRRTQKLKTRNKILKTAQRLISEGEVISLETVAEAADISRATIYRYFSNVEVLSLEAGLDIQTLESEQIVEMYGSTNLRSAFLAIQDYYNELGLQNELNFRKYLSIAIDPTATKTKRGARRVNTLTMALEKMAPEMPLKKQKLLINTATTLMGMEAIIVTKDVCGLNNKEAKETLKWGLTIILDSVL